MKKCLFVTVIVFCLLSCSNYNQDAQEDLKLLMRIAKLNKENKKLKDSLSRYERDFLYSQVIVGIPDEEVLKVGKKNNIKFLLHTYNREIPQYEIFKVNDTVEEKIGIGSSTMFEYEFIPKSVDDNHLDLKIKIPFKNRTIEIPAGLHLRIKE